MTPSVVRFAALLVATLVVRLSRLAAAMVGAVAWWVSLAPPSMARREPGHHGDAVAVLAPRPPMCRSARAPARRCLVPVLGAAPGPPRRGVLHSLFRSASRGPWESVATLDSCPWTAGESATVRYRM
jgi:hypothetical protein